MRSNVFAPAFRFLALVVSLWLLGTLVAADAPTQILPDSDYPKMVKYAVKSIQDALKNSAKEEQVTKARTAAVMLAAYAQQNLSGADGQLRATVRDAALKIEDTIDKKQYADASKQAAAIAKLEADPKASKEKVKLIDVHVRVRDLMNQFNHPPDGGYGIDRQFYAYRLGMKGKIPDNDLKDPLLTMAYQVAISLDMVNSKKNNAKPKEWEMFSDEVRQGAIELAEAVKAKNGTTGLDAVARMTTNCTACHKAFRAQK
jgi:hypothetical protein